MFRASLAGWGVDSSPLCGTRPAHKYTHDPGYSMQRSCRNLLRSSPRSVRLYVHDRVHTLTPVWSSNVYLMYIDITHVICHIIRIINRKRTRREEGRSPVLLYFFRHRADICNIDL